MLLLLGYAKILSNFSFLPKRYKALAVCWCKQPTSKSFQMCFYCIDLLKLYYKSTIIMLRNILSNIWSEISKNQLIFLMVYTCSVKRLEEVEKLGRNECTLHRWLRSLEMSDYISSVFWIRLRQLRLSIK